MSLLEGFDDVFAAFESAANLIDPPNTSKFKPLPHFMTPPGSFYMWMLFGGRGSGKTAHAAKYVHDHVHGPPCIPEVPGGHWISIVGPTLGDAVTSCVEGPSGLRAHDPGVRVLNRPGGLIARWTNGTEAKLFGANSPDDVERFRAGGNRCLVWCVREGTQVLTSNGPCNIELIEPGIHQVWTDWGWRHVSRNVMTNPAAEILEITLSSGEVLACTGEHRIFMADGTVQLAKSLVPGDTLTACTMSSYSKDGNTPRQTPASTTATNSEDSTVTCGNSTMGQSRQDGMSTTSTTTRPTTTSATSSASASKNTQPCTAGQVQRIVRQANSLASIVAGISKKNWDGFNQDSAAFSVETEAAPQQERLGPSEPTHVQAVEQSPRTRTSAALNATMPPVQLTMGNVTTAEDHSPDSSFVTVVKIATAPERSRVYDLTVPGPEHFYAAGVKVHNCEEFAAWRYLDEAWKQIRFGLRSGPRPHAIASTTPRPKKVIREIVKEARKGDGRYILSAGSTDTNPFLNEEVKIELYKDFAGTRMGRQELHGELLEDVDGALWSGELIDMHRVQPGGFEDRYDRIVVAIDPAATEGGDEHGIIVMGLKWTWEEYVVTPYPHLPHAFVLEDGSLNGSPNAWGKKAKQLYEKWEADLIVAERNNGGDMVASVLYGIDSSLPVKLVVATRGKTRRAEPIANLYEQGRIHHVGMFAKLEDQMTTWDSTDDDVNDFSPDHMDAMVWAATELMIGAGEVKQQRPEDTRLKGRR